MIGLNEPISAAEVPDSVTAWEMIEFKESLRKVIDNFASNAGLHCVFVVDPYEQLLGVITRHDLTHWISKKLTTISYHSLSDADKCIRLRNLSNSTQVREIMNRDGLTASIYQTDSHLHALNLMTEYELTVLPIINESNRIIGARTLSEILFQIIS
jgi:CBS-domain-containing membrane protein